MGKKKLTDQEFTQGWNAARERMQEATGGRLRWLLDFLNRDLDALSEGGWLDLGYDLVAFPYEARRESALGQYPSREMIRNLQAEVREGMKSLLEEGTWEPAGASVEIKLQRGSEPGDPRVRIDRSLIAEWRAACLARVADLLNVRDDRLRQCKECRRLFFAVKRQEYCTTRCSQATRTRRHREAHRDDAYARRHRAYQQSIERKHGPRVRPEKRGPRKKKAETGA